MPAHLPLSVRRTAVFAVATALGLAVTGAGASATGTTSLRIVYRASADAKPLAFTLGCGPPRGTVRQPAIACRRLASGGRALFAPTPPGVACSQIYGGPQTAVVTGTLAGRALWARFARRDGCEVDRWNRIAFLLPRFR